MSDNLTNRAMGRDKQIGLCKQHEFSREEGSRWSCQRGVRCEICDIDRPLKIYVNIMSARPLLISSSSKISPTNNLLSYFL